MIEMKRSVSRWMNFRKQNTFDTEGIGGFLSIMTEHLDDWRCPHYTIYTKNLESPHMSNVKSDMTERGNLLFAVFGSNLRRATFTICSFFVAVKVRAGTGTRKGPRKVAKIRIVEERTLGPTSKEKKRKYAWLKNVGILEYSMFLSVINSHIFLRARLSHSLSANWCGGRSSV